MELTPTIVDAIVFGVILLSAIFAYARGLTREAMTLIVWAAAGAAALKFYPNFVPIVQDVKDLGEWNKYAAIGVTFVAALIVFTIIGSFFAKIVANSPLRAIDKGLGFLFGAARGILFLAVTWIGYQHLVEPEYSHKAIKESKGGQLVQDSSDYVKQLLPTELPPFLLDAYGDFFGLDEAIDAVVPGPARPATNTNG